MSQTMSLDEVKTLIANDARCYNGVEVTVEEAGPYLHEYYLDTPRYNYGHQTGKFWQKVAEHAEVLRNSNEWPWEPIQVYEGSLMDGHHRTQAALIVDWQGDIPAEGW